MKTYISIALLGVALAASGVEIMRRRGVFASIRGRLSRKPS